MVIEIKIPSPGESITEVEIANWLVEDGAAVEKDQEVAEVESDKATLPLLAAESGKIKILAKANTPIKVGSVACTIDSEATGSATKVEAPAAKSAATPSAKQPDAAKPIVEQKAQPITSSTDDKVKVSPLAKQMMEEEGLSVDDIINGLKRIGRHEVELAKAGISQAGGVVPAMPTEALRSEDRNRMSSLRRKLAQRLVTVKNETAMLTTFNEVDMTCVMDLRKTYGKEFQEKHGVKVGFMSFFTKAVVEALKQHPSVNSILDGEEIITPHYYDIAIAVQTPKGLMVPVIRNAETLSLAGIERRIGELAEKARTGKITLDEMTGGTFTITNGGTYGSMMSTPILNPPQSGILGMHNIVDRPMAIDGKVEIRPMMYIALSYDHRVIDGKDSVGFLVKVKQMLENPELMLLGGGNPDRLLLGI
ncbi:2-oxoglutarate dehydrogenase complex dihydrolipoyllysine-residue succinyltransferase [Williamwhitmania taraxaci]|uniref:Dihydrolipoyllysine-residue succinyltransferase n=1 Tax=Williamwhitmania taraxaci TaxID=1640674 RepID=A0A1G6GUF0_9BACT|nr:2-oxoglutarate dehydrogenase complex dihydrolipoyllysine-residue succinyltransferase [Williamwhitmania taraxaci]SDB85578.1 2-oxoglutarate dehydrogenase E2 component [Williamwhitmania taraxaci]